MEILNQAIITPERLHALLSLVVQLKQAKFDDLLELIQPIGNHNTPRVILNNAIEFEFLVYDKTSDTVRPSHEVPSNVADKTVYQRFMQQHMTGIVEPQANNYLLNQMIAWYAVQNERLLMTSAEDITIRFNTEMYPSASDKDPRVFNETKFRGWRNWVVFLGWGLRDEFSGLRAKFMPDATGRLSNTLTTLLPETSWTNMRLFMQTLAQFCPELDGGVLFEQCWQASRPTEIKGTNISFMLSNALRVMERLQLIELKTEPDAGDLWHLFAAESMINRVTHIRRTAHG